MATERLSKLQKWILQRCAKQGKISRNEARRYFGKAFAPSGYSQRCYGNRQSVINERMFECGSMDESDYCDARPKQELCSTRSVEASISRSLTLLEKNGLIEWRRTEQDKDLFDEADAELGHHSWYAWHAYLTDKGKLKVNNGYSVVDVNVKD
jgi:hypothetical protein